jgi:hypothetical protein
LPGSFEPRQIRTRLLASEEFVAGRHGIARVDSRFVERFHPLSFMPASATEVIEIPLLRDMSDQEILRELIPRVATLADLFVHLHRSSAWPWGIWFLRGAKGQICSVACISRDGEWHINSDQRSAPWSSIYRAYSRPKTGFFDRLLVGLSRQLKRPKPKRSGSQYRRRYFHD